MRRRTGTRCSPFIGARERSWRARRGQPAVAPRQRLAAGDRAQMGSAWARADWRMSRSGSGPWARQKKKERNISRNYFSMQNEFQKSLENVFEARKILRKFPKFLENSQRQIRTRGIQIKHLELMKKIRAF